MVPEPLRILAIDDVQDNLISLKAVVIDAFPGVRFFSALNGLDGIEQARKEQPDVILLDIIMPGMDGFEVCQQLKSAEDTQHIPVIFLTALETDRLKRIRAVEVGGEAFLSKPIDELELTVTIQAMAKIKKANLLLRQEKEHLAELVAERTSELEKEFTAHRKAVEEKSLLEAQLQQAQKMESVGRLAGGVAHDFNNMLTVILGHSGMALMDMQPTDLLFEEMREIQKAAERSADLTRQLLAFARKQTVAPRALDLNETISGMLKMLQRLIGEDITLNWQPEPDLWQVMVDPSQIDQILANLCVNARDSISDIGNITIKTQNVSACTHTCTCSSDFKPGMYVSLSISDTGCGMDKDTMEHIFEPFFTTKAIGEGTGLGLATVYGAVKQNNGFINVKSEQGQGTRFTICLPRYIHQEEGVQMEQKQDLYSFGHDTILVVEDELSILKMTTLMLEKQGYIVLAANSSEEALRLASEHAGEISLLLSDVVMPEMNGRDLSNILMSRYPKIKRLFMSGYTSDVITNRGILDSGVSFIQKPFSFKELNDKVSQILNVN